MGVHPDSLSKGVTSGDGGGWSGVGQSLPLFLGSLQEGLTSEDENPTETLFSSEEGCSDPRTVTNQLVTRCIIGGTFQ